MLIDFSLDKTNDCPQVTFNHQQNVVLLMFCSYISTSFPRVLSYPPYWAPKNLANVSHEDFKPIVLKIYDFLKNFFKKQ